MHELLAPVNSVPKDTSAQFIPSSNAATVTRRMTGLCRVADL